MALLPGSRKQEIDSIFPEMLSAARMLSVQNNAEIVVGIAPTLEEEYFGTLYNVQGIHFIKGLTYEVMANADFAFVTSGTATLETALLNVPEVVCYKGSFLSYQIGKRLVNVKFISLVNLIMDKLVVKELIQNDLNAENLKKELTELLTDEKRITTIKSDYAALRNLLSQGGNASAKAAASITSFLKQ